MQKSDEMTVVKTHPTLHLNQAVFDKLLPLYKILGAEGFDSGDNRFFLPLDGFQNMFPISSLV